MKLQEIEFSAEELLKQLDPQGRLDLYCDTLKAENQKINLVSRETIESGLDTLIAESLLPLQVLGRLQINNYLDIGSGGGLPALPILLTSEIGRAVLVERTGKKAQALRRILRQAELPDDRIEIINSTVEDVTLEPEFDLITMRLVKLTPKLLKKITGLLAPDGVFVYYSKVETISLPETITALTYCYQSPNGATPKYFTLLGKIK